MKFKKNYLIPISVLLFLVALKCYYLFLPAQITPLPAETESVPFKFGKEIDLQKAENCFGKITKRNPRETTDGHLGRWNYLYGKPEKGKGIYGKEGEEICFKDGTVIFTAKNKPMIIIFSPPNIESNFGLKIGDHERLLVERYGDPYAVYKERGCRCYNSLPYGYEYVYKVNTNTHGTSGSEVEKYSEYRFIFDNDKKLTGVSFKYQKDDRYESPECAKERVVFYRHPFVFILDRAFFMIFGPLFSDILMLA